MVVQCLNGDLRVLNNEKYKTNKVWNMKIE